MIKETALLKPFVMVDLIPEMVEEIPDFIELKAVVAALLMLLLRDETVDFMAFQPEETTDLIPFTTPEILLLMALQMEETVDWIAERTVEMTVWIAVSTVDMAVWIADQTVEKVVCNPVRIGVTKATMAFQMEVIFVWIAVSAAPIRI